MTALAAGIPFRLRRRGGRLDRLADRGLHGLTALTAAGALVLLAAIAYKLFAASSGAWHAFGLGFLAHGEWNPVAGRFGAADLLFGTVVSSGIALLVGGPLAVAIALFLTELAPGRLRGVVGGLVDLLAAIPSVVLGLWGILVLGPFVSGQLEPALRSAFGWIPLFSGPSSPFGLLPAALVLTIMVVPIVSAISREVLLTIPAEAKEGALALGATRWEMVRMVVLPGARAGIAGAAILGLGRAVGEAIAVTQVIGGTAAVRASLFEPSDTMASRIASQYQGATSALQISSIAYLGAILLVIALAMNVAARLIVARTERANRAATR